MSKRIIAFSAVNAELGTSLSPNNRCARKLDAVDNNGKDIYGNSFARNRLITDVEVNISYTITFVDWNGTVLKTQANLAPNDTIVPPADPTRSGYIFTGWSPSLPADGHPTGNTTYRAQYKMDIPEHKGDPDQYFTITARTTGTVNFNISANADATVIRYRISDGSKDAYGDYIFGDWNTTNLTSGTASVITTSNLQPGYVVQWRGNGTHYGYGYGVGAYSYFSSTNCQFNISNNLLTLLYDTDVDSLTNDQKSKLDAQSDYCFVGLFAGCDKLISASDLYFPSNLVNGSNTPEHHFTDMFRDCVNLQTADFYISSGQLLDSAYERMFLGCSSLTVAPHLPSTQLGPHCYQAMFSGCTSLINAPELPATNLSAGCYDSMFGEYYYSTYDTTYSACVNLKNVTMRGTYYDDANAPASWYLSVGNPPSSQLIHPLKMWLYKSGTSTSGCTVHGNTGWDNHTEQTS